jgi:MOSC domain-containing protein YiiM
MSAITSDSVGDPSRFLTFDDLDRRLRALPAAPALAGRVALIVSRGEGGLRAQPDRIRLAPGQGIPGDAWTRRGPASLDAQITVMQIDVAEMLANGQPLTLFGDNLFVDLDLSQQNLPTGTRLRAGTAVLVVTPKPHNGCKKFRARFGEEALRFVSSPAIRPRNLRGIYMAAVEEGTIAVGDDIEVL